MSTTTITVGTADLRQALTAVKAHASSDKDFPDITRIRLTISEQNVTVSATDRFTAGLAVVSVWDHDGAPVELVELLREDVAKLLSIFHAPGKDSGEDGPQYLLRFEIGDDQVTVTDCSGFDIVGRKFRMPRLATEDALNLVPVLIERAHFGQIVLLGDITNMIVSGDHLARFKDAAKAYSEPLTIETRRGLTKGSATVLIRCGESFLGVMVPRRLLDEEQERARDYVEGWTARLPEIVAAAPVSEGA